MSSQSPRQDVSDQKETKENVEDELIKELVPEDLEENEMKRAESDGKMDIQLDENRGETEQDGLELESEEKVEEEKVENNFTSQDKGEGEREKRHDPQTPTTEIQENENQNDKIPQAEENQKKNNNLHNENQEEQSNEKEENLENENQEEQTNEKPMKKNGVIKSRKTKRKKNLKKKAKKIVQAKSESKTQDQESALKKGANVKTVQNWRKALKMPFGFEDRLDASQIYDGCLPTYIPSVPPGTSQRLIEHLSEQDLDMMCCPACKDRFLLPNTFFDHVYRKSISVLFSCQICHKTKTFYNRCQVKIHVLSHIETDGVSTVSADLLKVSSLSSQELVQRHSEGFSKELDDIYNSFSEGNPEETQCYECRRSVKKNAMVDHLRKIDTNRLLDCEHCSMSFHNRCSFSAHSRIHKRLAPYVCPECGTSFETFSVFQGHLERTCHHDAKVYVSTCELCSSGQKEDNRVSLIDSKNLVSHIFDQHVKLYFKCTNCSKAFTNKRAIYSHAASQHPEETKNPTKSDFTLLYKASFLEANNLFNSREDFQEKVELLSEKWKRFSKYRCFSCKQLFDDLQSLESHNRFWCGLQVGDRARSSILFDSKPSKRSSDERRKKIEELITELKTLLEEDDDCMACKDSLVRLQNHKTHGHSNEPHVKDKEKQKINDIDASQNVKRSRKQRFLRSQSKDTTNDSLERQTKTEKVTPENKLSQSPKQDSKPVAIKTEENPCPKAPSFKTPVGKRNAKTTSLERQPFVESLGKDVPSAKRLLTINNLCQEALSLGSSVAKRSKKTDESLQHSCALCQFKSDSKDSFRAHILIHQPRDKEHFQCTMCGMSFASKSAWKMHLFLLHSVRNAEPEEEFVNSPAKSSSQDPFEFNEKLLIEEGEVFRPRSNVCKVCARAFSTPLELRRHFRSHGMAFLKTSKK